MERWILVADTNCSIPTREEEFNHWYNTIHIPDVLEAPGILRATRYESNKPREGHGKYLAVYDIETEDIEQLIRTFGEIVAEKKEQGRMSELLTVIYGAYYKQMAPPIEEK